MEWRKNVDTIIKGYLDLQVKEASKFKNAYLKSKNPANAQLWIAIANLSKHMFSLELKIKYLEGTIKDLNERLNKLSEKKPEDVLNELEKEAKQSKKEVKKIKGSLRRTLKKF